VNNHSISFIAALSLILSACATTQRPPRAGENPMQSSRLQDLLTERSGDPSSRGYRIGVGDTVHVAVAQAKEVSGDYAVPEDGRVKLPLIGDVVAVGKSETELASTIAGMLKAQYLQAPEVIVTVASFVGRQATVMGAVARPGFYELRGGRDTMLDLLTRAGGITEDASPRIYFTPGSEGAGGAQRVALAATGARPSPALIASSDKPIEIDLTELYQGGSVPALQLPVRNGDVIFVKEGGQIFVEGWVEDPKPYPLKRAMTLTQAISKAGGLHFAAAPGSVTLFREDTSGVLREYPVNFDALRSGAEKDIYLEPGDKIHVAGNPLKVGVWGVYNTITSVVRLGIAGGVTAF
jgi:polysaccharide biosynthesis/export protein